VITIAQSFVCLFLSLPFSGKHFTAAHNRIRTFYPGDYLQIYIQKIGFAYTLTNNLLK
jgi:hypothetical protein